MKYARKSGRTKTKQEPAAKAGRSLALRFGAASVVIAAVAWWTQTPPKSPAAGPVKGSASAATAQPLPSGTQLTYTLSLATHAKLTLGIGPEQVDQELKGTLTATVLASGPEGRELLLQVVPTGSALNLNGREAGGADAALAAGLGGGFLSRYDASGALVSVGVPAAFDGVTEATAHQVAALLQTSTTGIASAGAAAAPWTVTEHDGMGTYRARYADTGNEGGEIRMSKEILDYTQPEGAHGPGITPRPSGILALVVSAEDHVLMLLRGDQRIELAYATGGNGGTSVTTCDIALQRRSRLAAGDLLALTQDVARRQLATSAQAPGASRHAATSVRAVQERELGGKSLGDLGAELAALDAQDAPPDAAAENGRRRLFLQLRAVLFLDPQQAQAVGRLGAALTPGGDAFNLVVGALASTQSPEAQAGLRLIVEAVSGTPRLVAELLPSLSMYEHPTAATESFLRKLAADSDAEVQEGARLSLGIAANRLRAAGDFERTQVLVGDALAQLTAAHGDAATTLALKVLGNTAAPEALAAVTPLLGEAAPGVRRQAANALRFVPGSGADAALLGALGGDADPEVRAAAADALGYRPANAGLLAAEQQRFAAENSVDVRLRLLRDIYAARSVYPDAALAFVRDVGERSDVAELRDAAQKLAAAVN